MREPFHGLKILGPVELAISRQIAIRFGHDGKIPDLVDALAELVAVVLFGCRHLRHGEIYRIQRNAL